MINRTEKRIKGNAIYQPAGAAEEYSKWACNLYKGCDHDCAYCYCKHGPLAHTLGGPVAILKKTLGNEQKAFDIFKKELATWRDSIIADGGLLFSFSTDPMLKKTYDLNFRCILHALEQQVPVTILTKAAWWVTTDWIIGSLWPHRDILRIGFTLTGHDELEPGADSNVRRQSAILMLNSMQFRTFASMEPVIDFEKSLAIIMTIADVCPEFRIGLQSPFRKDQYQPEQCKRFILTIDRLTKKHNITVTYKESVRKYVEKILLPFLYTEADAFGGSDMGLEYAQAASDIQRIVSPVPASSPSCPADLGGSFPPTAPSGFPAGVSSVVGAVSTEIVPVPAASPAGENTPQ